jgi:hypothetical protein
MTTENVLRRTETGVYRQGRDFEREGLTVVPSKKWRDGNRSRLERNHDLQVDDWLAHHAMTPASAERMATRFVPRKKPRD